MRRLRRQAGKTDKRNEIIANQPGAKHLQTIAGWRGMFVPKSSSDPVAAYNFMKFMYSEEGQCLSLRGEEGVDWNWDEEHSYPVLNYDFESPNEEDGMKFWGWIYHDGIRNTLPGYGNAGQTFKAREAATSISETNPVLGMLRMGVEKPDEWADSRYAQKKAAYDEIKDIGADY